MKKRLTALLLALILCVEIFPVMECYADVNGTVCGDFTVYGGVLGTDFKYSNHTLEVISATPLTISNTDSSKSTTDNICADLYPGTVDITLAGVNIDRSSLAKGSQAAICINGVTDLKITLADDTVNNLKSAEESAGIRNRNGSLTIDGGTKGNGKLIVTAGEGAAGIGGDSGEENGSITIKGGYVEAYSTLDYSITRAGAAIGGGNGNYGSDITISGGYVKAVGIAGSAAIGGGVGGNGSFITVSGGIVELDVSGEHCAGLGGGNSGTTSNISITGGTVICKNGTPLFGMDYQSNASDYLLCPAKNLKISESLEVFTSAGRLAHKSDEDLAERLYKVKYDSNGIPYLSVITVTSVRPHKHDETLFNKVLFDGGSLTSGNYFIQTDITITEDIVIPKGEEVNLCLNGFTLYLHGHKIVKEGTLNVVDCSGGGKITCGDTYHSYEFENDGEQYWQVCEICGDTTEKKDIPEGNVVGENLICPNVNYTFTASVPAGCSVVSAEIDNGVSKTTATVTEESGVFSGSVPSAGFHDANSFTLTVYAKTEDGFGFSFTKDVSVGHYGGKATYNHRAICDACGEEYGDYLEKHTLLVIGEGSNTEEQNPDTGSGATILTALPILLVAVILTALKCHGK